MGIVGKLFNKSAQISLLREEQDFVLLCYYGDELTPFSTVLEKWPEISDITPFINTLSLPKSLVSIEELDDVRSLLRKLKETNLRQRKLSFYIPTDIEGVEILSNAPDDFEIKYIREDNILTRQLPDNVNELTNGWLRRNNQYWKYERAENKLTSRFRKEKIQLSEWLSFAKDDLSLYRSMGVKIRSDIEYNSSPAFELHLCSCETNHISLEPVWNVDAESIDESIYWENHICVLGIIYPGITPSKVSALIPNVHSKCDLSHSEIADFLDHSYPTLKRWMQGDLNAFERMHCWAEPPYRWELEAGTQITRCIGKAYAYPIACIGGERFSVEQLKQILHNQYTRITDGWIRQSDLLSLGMDENGIMSNGTAMKPIRLDADALLHCGSASLGNHWSAMQISGAEWICADEKHICAEKHLEYLLYWGVNGGLTGGYESMVAYGIPLLLRLAQKEKNCKILIVGNRTDTQAIKKDFCCLSDLLCFQDFQIVSYGEAAQNSDICTKRRDLLIMIEPDAETTEDEKKYIKAASVISSGCKLGFFCNKSEKLLWDSELLGYKTASRTAEYLIRDCREKCDLPVAYTFQPQPSSPAVAVKESNETIPEGIRNSGVDIVLPGNERAGIPIPKKASDTQIEFSFDSRYDNRNESFFSEAKKLANYAGSPTEHVSFFCYWPKYADMTGEQKKWYFYLRNELRNGKTPTTDLSYLFVYCYELINQIGVQDAADGYHKLKTLLDVYGGKYPSLQNYLCDWLFDYIHIYPCDISVEQLISGLPKLSVRIIDTQLSTMSESNEFSLSLLGIESLTKYRVTSSKFYQNGNQDLMTDTVLGVLTGINEQLLKTKGKGILNAYAPLKLHTDVVYAFAGALTEEQKVYSLRIRHYHEGLRFCSYLKNVVRYTENTLRIRKKYASKLQGIELDDKTKRFIDSFIDQSFANVSKPDTGSIQLDMRKLEQLRTDSDEVRETLIASVSEIREDESKQDITSIPRPKETPDGLLTDLDPINAILRRLSPMQQRIIKALQSNQWKAEPFVLRSQMPNALPEGLIDQINEISVAILGCALIEREVDCFIVAEDYRDELEYLMPKQSGTAHWKAVIDMPDEDWIDFFSQADIEALGALSESVDAFRTYAKVRGSMPDLLLDELNALAADIIGDLIADENGICEDYADLVHEHLKKEC